MGYGYIPENRRAKDVRVDNYDKKFPEGVTNVEDALDHLNKELNNIANELKLIGSGNTIKLMLGTKELSSLTISNGTVEPTPTTYSITNTLSNCTNSNTATTIEENTSYSANISTNEGYRLKDITVTMGE